MSKSKVTLKNLSNLETIVFYIFAICWALCFYLVFYSQFLSIGTVGGIILLPIFTFAYWYNLYHDNELCNHKLCKLIKQTFKPEVEHE